MGGIFWVVIAMLVGFLILLVLEKGLLVSATKAMSWPPGPPKIPIFGNLHQLHKGGRLVHHTLANMTKEYGSIMTVWFGRTPTIVISDHHAAWEVLVTRASDYASRTLPYKARITSAGWHTLATCDFGSYWYSLRKGVLSTALSPVTVSAQMHLQVNDVIAVVRSIEAEASANNGVVNPLIHLRRCTIRLIARLCFGSDFSNDKFIQEMDCVTEDCILQTSHTRLADIFPLLRYIPGLRQPFQEVYQVKCRIENLIRPLIIQYQSSESPNPNCYLQFLLSQDMEEEVVIFNIFEMFLLAVDSTSLATAWALGFLIHYPLVQDKLYKEVIEDSLKGTIGIEKASKMKYLHAVVKESTRMRPIAPLAVPHKAVKDSTLMGRRIEQGTSVTLNLYAVLHDPKVWIEPHKFNPDRFLISRGEEDEDNEGAMKGMERSFLPFGAGRRVCPGMELAKIHVALILANLVKSFEWLSAVEGQLPDLTEDLTFILRMKTPLSAKIVPRCT
uniref:Cytochrome P450 CYP 1 n=1 Tax=Asarum sieboldii TaxID=76098 RepID=A0AAU7PIR7_9MAGN